MKGKFKIDQEEKTSPVRCEDQIWGKREKGLCAARSTHRCQWGKTTKGPSEARTESSSSKCKGGGSRSLPQRWNAADATLQHWRDTKVREEPGRGNDETARVRKLALFRRLSS